MATITVPAPVRREIFEPEHEDYRDSYARFLQAEVVPHYAEWEKACLVPRELFRKCAEHGFLAMEVPEEYGGNERRRLAVQRRARRGSDAGRGRRRDGGTDDPFRHRPPLPDDLGQRGAARQVARPESLRASRSWRSR